jgi:hypothetical protein
VRRRLSYELELVPEDLGLVLPEFSYRASFGDAEENELCPVFVCRLTRARARGGRRCRHGSGGRGTAFFGRLRTPTATSRHGPDCRRRCSRDSFRFPNAGPNSEPVVDGQLPGDRAEG